MIIGLINMILYLNLLNIGYSFIKYLKFIFNQFECRLYLYGLIIIILTLIKKEKKNDIYL